MLLIDAYGLLVQPFISANKKAAALAEPAALSQIAILIA